MDFKLINIGSEVIEFSINDLVFEATYELEYSHSEGESNIDPQRNTYMEFFELNIGDEVLLNVEDEDGKVTQEYRSWKPAKRTYQFIRNAVQNYNYHIEVI